MTKQRHVVSLRIIKWKLRFKTVNNEVHEGGGEDNK